MFEIDDILKSTLLIYIAICFFIYQMKPDFMFHKNGEFKQFGTGPNKTIYPFWLVTTISGIIVFLYLHIKGDDFV